uniref:F-box domain-containing protein n=3 Tax=Brassica campestris TaxID=3711 RepID=M4DX63_BRACM
MAKGHQGKCFGFVLLLCFFSSTFARRILKDLDHVVKPGKVSLREQDHGLFSLEPDHKVKPGHNPQSAWWGEPEEPEDKVKPDHKLQSMWRELEEPDPEKKHAHKVMPDYKEKLNDGGKEKIDDIEKPDHIVKPNYKEKLNDKEKIDGIEKPDHTVKPMGYGYGVGYGSGGSGFGEGIGSSGGSGFGEGIGSSGGSGFGEGIGSSGGSGFGEGIGYGDGSGVGIGEGRGSGYGQPNCGPVRGAPGRGFGEGIGRGSGSGEGIGIGRGGSGSTGVPSVVVPPITVPGTTIPPITVPGTHIPGFTIPGVTVPGFGTGGGCQTGEFRWSLETLFFKKKAERNWLVSLEDLPSHLILEVLTSGRLNAVDLLSLELTSKVFGGSSGLLYPLKFRSLADYAASRLCYVHPVYAGMGLTTQKELFANCEGNWKRLLRFLQSVDQSSDMVQTSAGNMQVTTGRYHTLLINNSKVYSCGSSLSGVLAHGPETTQCVAFTPIEFPFSAKVAQVSATHNHSAFVLQSGEVLTCGDNSSHCCGHLDTSRPIFRPKLVEALKGTPCKQVAAGLHFSVFLSREGRVFTCGSNTHGQLGHGDTLDSPVPRAVEFFQSVGPVVQIATGPSYVLAVTQDGSVYSFGSGSTFCLGHGEQQDEHQPRVIQAFKRRGVHILRVSAGDEHAVALDSNGRVYTWGKGYCGALGHGDENDKITPQVLVSLNNCLAVQVCARKRKTFVLVEGGVLYGFGWMGFGSLGFPDRGASDKVLRPRVLESLKQHRVSQVSTGLYHTIVVTQGGRIFGFGDNERAQLGHDSLRTCLEPTEIFLHCGHSCSQVC